MDYRDPAMKRLDALFHSIRTFGIPFRCDEHVDTFRTLLHAYDGLLSERPDGTLNFINESAQSLFGYGWNEAMGLPSKVLVPEGLQDERAKLFERVLTEGLVLPISGKRITKSKELVSVAGYVFPYEFSSDIYSIAAVVNKIS